MVRSAWVGLRFVLVSVVSSGPTNREVECPAQPQMSLKVITAETHLPAMEAYETLRRDLEQPGHGTALDLGAGTGFSTKVLYDLGYTGGIDAVDPSGVAWQACHYASGLKGVAFYAETDVDFLRGHTRKMYDAISVSFGMTTAKAEAIGQAHLIPGGRMFVPVEDGSCVALYQKTSENNTSTNSSTLQQLRKVCGWAWQPDMAEVMQVIESRVESYPTAVIAVDDDDISGYTGDSSKQETPKTHRTKHKDSKFLRFSFFGIGSFAGLVLLAWAEAKLGWVWGRRHAQQMHLPPWQRHSGSRLWSPQAALSPLSASYMSEDIEAPEPLWSVQLRENGLMPHSLQRAGQLSPTQMLGPTQLSEEGLDALRAERARLQRATEMYRASIAASDEYAERAYHSLETPR